MCFSVKNNFLCFSTPNFQISIPYEKLLKKVGAGKFSNENYQFMGQGRHNRMIILNANICTNILFLEAIEI